MDITHTVYTTDITAIRECFGEKAYCLKMFIGMTHRYVCASFRYSLRLMLRYPVCAFCHRMGMLESVLVIIESVMAVVRHIFAIGYALGIPLAFH